MQLITEKDKPRPGSKMRAVYDSLDTEQFRTPKDVAVLMEIPEHLLYSCYFSDLRKRGLIISQLSNQLRNSGNQYWEHKQATHKQPVQLLKPEAKATKQPVKAVSDATASAKLQIAEHLAAIEQIVDTMEERIKTSLIEKMFDQL